MGESSEDRTAGVERRLALASSIVARLEVLDVSEAERIGARIDRLARQIAAIRQKSPAGTRDHLHGAN